MAVSINRLIKKEMEKLPRLILINIVMDKLDGIGVRNKPDLAEALCDHLLKGNDESFKWEDDDDSLGLGDKKIELEFSEKDFEKFEGTLSAFLENDLPSILLDVSEETAKVLLKSLKRKWPEQDAYQEAVLFGFLENLEERWGKAFDLLRMLRTVSLETGEEAFNRLRKSKARKNRMLRSVLLRLHARACQISGEIILLIENGYADGAMARWRTLYEVVVVAKVIADGGEELAKRYAEHDIVETKAEMDEFERCQEALGYKPVSKLEKRTVEKAHETAIKNYGKEFGSTYGWAANHLNMKKPILKHLENAVAHSHMRPYYKLASQNVHAGAKRMTFQLGSLGDEGEHIIPGQSNAGIDEPGQNTAISLMQITALLNDERMTNLDVIVETKTLVLLCDDVTRAFVRAARKLQRDELETNGR